MFVETHVISNIWIFYKLLLEPNNILILLISQYKPKFASNCLDGNISTTVILMIRNCSAWEPLSQTVTSLYKFTHLTASLCPLQIPGENFVGKKRTFLLHVMHLSQDSDLQAVSVPGQHGLEQRLGAADLICWIKCSHVVLHQWNLGQQDPRQLLCVNDLFDCESDF